MTQNTTEATEHLYSKAKLIPTQEKCFRNQPVVRLRETHDRGAIQTTDGGLWKEPMDTQGEHSTEWGSFSVSIYVTHSSCP